MKGTAQVEPLAPLLPQEAGSDCPRSGSWSQNALKSSAVRALDEPRAVLEGLGGAAAVKHCWDIFSELVKLRLTSLVLLTTLVGFYMGSRGPMDQGLMLVVLAATGLLAGGAAALNQYLEREFDAKMRRTQDRPLPSGRLKPPTVLRLGVLASISGVVWLSLGVNWLTGAVGAATLVSYLFIYTPLKRVSWLNTMAGAVPGGLPPLLGWAAATQELGAGGWALFAIQFFWQVPHFMAIAWLYREDYARAGFQMLPLLDPTGERTGRQALIYAAGLLAASLTPVACGMAGPGYLAGAVALGLAFVGLAWQFARRRETAEARRLFYLSILYLPALLVLLVINKTWH